MGKVKKPRDCCRSPTGSTPPRCVQAPSTLCQPCGIAMVYDNQIKDFHKASGKQRNRDPARLSGMKEKVKFSNLLAENMALSEEHDNLVKELETINAANEATKEKISAKVQEILAATLF